MNKRGAVDDLAFMGAMFIFLAIAILIGFKVASEFNSHVAADSDMPAEATTATSKLLGYYPGVIDNAFLIFVIGSVLSSFILASLVRIHPIFIVMFFLSWVVVIFTSGVLSNIYTEMASNPQLIAQATQLTFVGHIFQYLPLIVGIVGGILMVIMYKLWLND